MTQKDRNELVKELREKTGAGMMDCKKALEACDFNIDKAVKYLKYMPNNPPMDYWSSKQYLLCEHCDRFYIVKRGIKKCNVCGNDLLED